MAQLLPAYRRHGRQYDRSYPLYRAGVKTWTMVMASGKLELMWQRTVILIQQTAWVPEDEELQIAPVQVPVSAQSAPANSKNLRDLSHTV